MEKTNAIKEKQKNTAIHLLTFITVEVVAAFTGPVEPSTLGAGDNQMPLILILIL